ncbi:hypothetical protein LWI28_001488 [Acer negundo]|uniref:Uncharacterized protein n=1 Tax=Acer negundo TaxID=4023 RepID=A0AAD5IK74_ACENE|nr:hypothetical protein LWI28_001488 [Acer negundo]
MTSEYVHTSTEFALLMAYDDKPHKWSNPSRYHPTRSFLDAVRPSSDRRAAASLDLSSSSPIRSSLHKAHFQSFGNWCSSWHLLYATCQEYHMQPCLKSGY